MVRVVVTPEQAGRRVDAVVASALPGASANAARRLVMDGRVRLDGKRARKGDRAAAGQALEIDAPVGAGEAADAGGTVGAVLPDPSLAVVVLHADEALVAIDKPAGISSHPLRPGELGTAANAIVARFPECATASPDPREGGVAHRLDRGTSGVLLAARNAGAWLRLRAALRADGCEKTYLAEVVGHPASARGVVDAPIGRSGRRGVAVRVGGAGRQPLPARTAWEVLELRAGTALVRARLHAGRAHQVRAHLAAAGSPIVGDPLYGGGDAAAPAGAGGGPRLHAAAISFAHPTTGAATTIEAPPPPWAVVGIGTPP